MLDLLNFVTFIWLAFWALRAFLGILAGVRPTILFVIIIHFFLNGLPLFLDVIVGQPKYSNQPGFLLASRDETTAIIYCVYVSAIPVFWWWAGKADSRKTEGQLNYSYDFTLVSQLSGRIRPILFLFLVIPIILFIFAPDPSFYLQYAANLRSISLSARDFHPVVAIASQIGIIAGSILVGTLPPIRISRNIRFPALFVVLPFIVFATWLHGKRSVVAMTLLLTSVVLWHKGTLRGWRLLLAGVTAITALATFSFAYQKTVRNIDPQILYQNVRIDFGRDDAIKMTIFAEQNPEQMKILEHRGQSFLFYATMYVPREMWPEKPLPYAQYFTSAMLEAPPRLWGWGMTTSILEESIANIGWLGMIFGPLVIAIICRLGDSQKNIFVYALTVLVASLFLAVHLVAFATLFLLWLIIVLWSALRKRRRIKSRIPIHYATSIDRP